MTEELAEQDLKDVSDATRLTEEAYAPYLDELGDGWRVDEGDHLEGTFEFADFREALDFAVAVGELAESAWHHPTISISWGEVVVTFWTHEIDGLHKNDFVMAARTDRLYADEAN